MSPHEQARHDAAADPYRTPVPNEIDELRSRVTDLERRLDTAAAKIKELRHDLRMHEASHGGVC